MSKEQLRDGQSTLATYVFDINHSAEEDDDQRRNVTRTAPTTGPGFVRQQGESAPVTFKFTGTIMSEAQYAAMQSYYLACANRSVFFRDHTNTEHEVIITVFSARKERVAYNSRSPSLLHVWRYSLWMEVIA